MDEFVKYLEYKTKGELKKELIELYSTFDSVKDYYQSKITIKGQGVSIKVSDSKVIERNQQKIIEALNLDHNWQGGFDTEKVGKILSRIKSKSKIRDYIELSLVSIEECTDLANTYGGDFGEEFYLFFSKLYRDVLEQALKEGLEKEYQEKLKLLMENSFEGYGYQDDLEEIYLSFFGNDR